MESERIRVPLVAPSACAFLTLGTRWPGTMCLPVCTAGWALVMPGVKARAPTVMSTTATTESPRDHFRTIVRFIPHLLLNATGDIVVPDERSTHLPRPRAGTYHEAPSPGRDT